MTTLTGSETSCDGALPTLVEVLPLLLLGDHLSAEDRQACSGASRAARQVVLLHASSTTRAVHEASTQHATQADEAMQQDTTAPPVRTNYSVWDLITGPEASHWSALLVRDHLDGRAKQALYHTARRHTTSALLGGLAPVPYSGALCMIIRQSAALLSCPDGHVRTRLELRGRTSFQLMDTLRALQEGTTGLDELLLVCEEELISKVLAVSGRSCPNLQALHIPRNRLNQKLPSPELFPKLRALSFGLPQQLSVLERVVPTTAPYVKQLTHLAFPLHSKCSQFVRHLPQLLSPTNNAAHLHSFQLDARLNDTLLGLVLQFAPALQQLGVASLKLQSAVHVHAQTQWQRLQVRWPNSQLCLCSLAHLPQTPWLELVCGSGQLTLRCDTTDEQAVAARLNSMRLSIRSSNGCKGAIQVQASSDMDVGDQPAALRSALSLLRRFWPADGGQPTIKLDGWTVSVELMHELPGLPRWSKLQCPSMNWQNGLQPSSYTALLGLLPDSYRDVSLNVRSNTLSTNISSICSGVPSIRPLRLELVDCVRGHVHDIQAAFPDVVFKYSTAQVEGGP